MRAIMPVLLLMVAVSGTFFAADATIETEELKVRFGTTKTTKVGKISIKFTEVVEDSRCPESANCVWAGRARIRVILSHNDSDSQTFEMNSSSGKSSTGEAEIIYRCMKIKFAHLTPLPDAGKATDRKAYEATFVLEPLGKPVSK